METFAKNALTFSGGNNVQGRPSKFKTELDLIVAMQDYFDYCDNRTTSMYVKELGDNVSIANPAPYTMSGLARHMGVDRDTLLRYSKKDEFYGTVRAAKSKIEEDVETRLLEGKSSSGAIFALKNNHGWIDKTQQDNNHTIALPILSSITKPSDDKPVIDVEAITED